MVLIGRMTDIGEQASFTMEALNVLEKVLVLADGSIETPMRYVDMAPSAPVQPKVVQPEIVQSEGWMPLVSDSDVQEIVEMSSKEWSQVDKPDLPSTTAEVASPSEGVLEHISPTALADLDMSQAVRNGIAAKVSGTVAVHRVGIPPMLLAALLAWCTPSGVAQKGSL